MKRVLAVILVILMLTLPGCQVIAQFSGTLKYDADKIDHIRIHNPSTGKEFSVSDRDAITTIIKHINSFTLEDGNNFASTVRYSLVLMDRSGEVYNRFTIVSANQISTDMTYTVKAKDLLNYVEALECGTMTDNELIDVLLQPNTLDRLNILDAEGNISFDKILTLPQTCPALFELLGRPSAIGNLGSYGVDKIKDYLSSNNPELVETALEWMDVAKQLMPELEEKLNELIENYKNTENNP